MIKVVEAQPPAIKAATEGNQAWKVQSLTKEGSPSAVLTPASLGSTGPTGSIAISLAQQPPPSSALWQNGTVLVAGFALFGVLVTVLFAHLRMKAELAAAATRAQMERDHSRDEARLERDAAAEEAHKERISTTRRQVYLEAVEALGDTLLFLGGLPKQDLEKLDYRAGMGRLVNAVNRISVVGETQTVFTARKLSTILHQQFFLALAKVMPLSQYRFIADLHQSRWDETQLEIKRILAAMANHSETANPDRSAFEALDKSFAAQQKIASEAAAARQIAQNKFNQGQLEFLDFITGATSEITLELDQLTNSIRKELSIATDFEAVRAQTLQMMADAAESVAGLMNSVKQFGKDFSQ